MPRWRMKAALQQLFSSLPGGHHLNFLFQRHVTRGLPISDDKLKEVIEIAEHHIRALGQWSAIAVPEGRFFEFGAGWDLHLCQTLYCLGVNDQSVVDIRSLLKPQLVFEIRDRLLATPHRAFRRTPPSTVNSLSAYLVATGIDYRAPCDARSTRIPTGGVDFITSTDTLEHIPIDEIREILTECRRILSDDGAMSFQIDYQDHYSYFDRRLSPYNFLRFDARTWRRYNPGLHYQNRLRHLDYLELFADAGFEVVAAEVAAGTSEDEAVIDELGPAAPFRDYSPSELAVRGASVVLRKAGSGSR